MSHSWNSSIANTTQSESEAELRALVAAIEDLIIVFDREGRCLKIAPTNPKLLFKEATEQIGKTVYENLPFDQADLHFQAIQQALATQQTSSFEHCVVLDGRETWFSAKVSPLSADTVVMVSRDVTSLKQAEAELRSFFNAMPDITLVFDQGGCCLKVLAPVNEKVFVLPPTDLIGKTVHETLPKDKADLQMQFIRQCIETQKTITNIDYSLQIGDAELWFSANVSPLLENTVIWVARDISDRRRSELEREQAEADLQQSEQRNRVILEAIPDLMFRVSREGVYLGYIKTNSLTDLLAEEVSPVGRQISEELPPEVAQRHIRAIHQALGTGQLQVYEQEIMINDRLQHEEVRVIASGADEVLFMIRDISDRKQAEASLQASLKQLAVANQEITLLNQRLQSENLRMSAELAIARQLQQMVLPKEHELQQIAGLDIAGFMQPADEVGGDYYDVLQHNGQVKIGIGDVTGHGLESGVLMLMTQTAVRTLLEHQETDSTKFLTTLNRVLYNNIQRMNCQKNLTLTLLDYESGRIRVSGQHEEVLVVRSGGQLERMDTNNLGFPLGVVIDIAEFICQTEVQLQPGDGVVLYTDGITEARNLERQQYGLERLCQLISQSWQQTAETIRQVVIEDVQRHMKGQPIQDDLTLLVLKQQ